MKSIDFSFLGGFPLEQETLGYMQSRDTDILKAIVKMGIPDGYTDPLILSGCVYDSGSNSYSAGWLYVNDEVIPFAGGVVPGAGTYCLVQTYKTTVIFEDSTPRDVYVTKAVVYGTGVGSFELLNIARFREQFGVDSVEADTGSLGVSVNIGTAPYAKINGTIYYRKCFVPKMLHLYGTLTLTDASNMNATPEYTTMHVLLPAYTPPADVPFKANVDYSATYIKDVLDTDFIKDINGVVTDAGFIKLGFIKPLAGINTYAVSFNMLIPLL